jgi:hypothetical protein
MLPVVLATKSLVPLALERRERARCRAVDEFNETNRRAYGSRCGRRKAGATEEDGDECDAGLVGGGGDGGGEDGR